MERGLDTSRSGCSRPGRDFEQRHRGQGEVDAHLQRARLDRLIPIGLPQLEPLPLLDGAELQLRRILRRALPDPRSVAVAVQRIDAPVTDAYARTFEGQMLRAH